MEFIGSMLASIIRLSTPILIAGIGIVFAARAGIVNVGLEGFMLMGALMGVVGSYISGLTIVGALLAMASVCAMAAIFAYFTINLYANQTVVGTAFNIFSAGLTTTVNRLVFGVSATVPSINVYEKVAIPLLCKIPVIGDALFNQPLLCYFAYIMVPVAGYVMYRTNIGLSIRAVGENPKACDTLGIDVYGIRWGTILFGGCMAGLAGSYMSMGNLSYFVENMVAGQGFMVLAVVVLGSYSLKGVMFAALLFGTSQALQYRVQGMNTGIPYQFLNMIPYIITLLAVCGFMKVSNQPAAGGKPYIKE